jgi:riboflavin synthase alpha subunit
MKDYKTGDLVNVEFDMIGKYIINTLENWKGVQLQ